MSVWKKNNSPQRHRGHKEIKEFSDILCVLLARLWRVNVFVVKRFVALQPLFHQGLLGWGGKT